MAITASTLILAACRMIGSKTPGDTLTTNEQTDFLYDLNSWMDSIGLDVSLCYQLLQESKALSANVSSYTIGTGAAFNTTRPNDIVDPCFVRDAANTDYPLKIIDAIAYGRLNLKSVTGSFPTYLFYDHAFASSLGTIFLYPMPNAAGYTLYINSWKQLQSFAAISTAIALPPGYQLMIESNFAIRLAGGLTNVSPEVAKIARDSMARVRSLNLPDTIMRCDPTVAGAGAPSIILGA